MLVLKCDLDVFRTIILENILHFNTNILLLDFSFNIFLFLIKYLVITSPEYDRSFCFEIRRQNGFAQFCMQFWDTCGRENSIEIFRGVAQHENFIVFIEICFRNIHFFVLKNFIEF